MKDFRGNSKLVKAFRELTVHEFAEAYNELSMSPDKLPVASTPIPIIEEGGKGVMFEGKQLYNWLLFYETKESPTQETKKPVTKLSMEL
jgi:hypothetical protein